MWYVLFYLKFRSVDFDVACTYVFGILNIIWRETKARLSTHATQKSKMAGLLVDVACVLSLAFVFAPNNIKNPE